MNVITEPILMDLLRLYHDGEASADTRTLVERYLAEHPGLRDRAAAAASVRIPAPDIRLECDHALQALERTKAALTRQKWTQFFAILLTLAPFSFVFSGEQLTFWMIRDAPLSLIPIWSGAAALWISYARSRRAGR